MAGEFDRSTDLIHPWFAGSKDRSGGLYAGGLDQEAYMQEV